MGMFGKKEYPTKTFSSLPPHWSLSLRFDLLMYASFDVDDYIEVKIDDIAYGHFTKASTDTY